MESNPGGSSPQSQPGNQGQPGEPSRSQPPGEAGANSGSQPGQPGSADVVPDDVRDQILAERAKIAESGLPRTNLDPEMMKRAIDRQTAERELKVAELLKAKAAEPVKPFLPIENYKTATPCSSTWEGSDPKERVRFCQKCQLQVYDFTGLQQPEADELIFKRENRKDAPLFKRQDGKFLTSDCPAALRAKRSTIIAMVAGGAVVACIIAVLVMMPKPAPRVVPEPTQASKPGDGTSSGGTGRTASKNPTPAAAPTVTPTSSPGSTTPGSSAYSEYLKSQQGLDQEPATESTYQPTGQASPPAEQAQPPSPQQPQPATATPAGQAETALPSPATEPASSTAENQGAEPVPASDQPAPSDHGVKYYGK